MKIDVSIHFTIKNQTVDEIDAKLTKFFEEHQDNLPFCLDSSTVPRGVVHHCFIPEPMLAQKGFSNEIYEKILNHFAEKQIYWYGSSNLYFDGKPNLYWDRQLMLENLAKLQGLAIFVGKIEHGVKEEYEIAKSLGLEILEIP